MMKNESIRDLINVSKFIISYIIYSEDESPHESSRVKLKYDAENNLKSKRY